MLFKKEKATHKATRQGPFSVGSPLSLSGHAARAREPKRKSWDSGSRLTPVWLQSPWGRYQFKKNGGSPKNQKKKRNPTKMGRKPHRTAERLGAARSPAGKAAAEKKANAEAVPATVKGSKRSRALTAVTAANIATTSSQAKLPAAKNAGQVRRVLCASRLPRRVGFGSSRLHRPSLRTPAGIDAASPTGPSATTPAGTQRDSSSRWPCYEF